MAKEKNILFGSLRLSKALELVSVTINEVINILFGFPEVKGIFVILLLLVVSLICEP